jgi:4,5-DOPA dioxygenase extradiol
MAKLPSLFVSHGSPSFLLERGPAFDFLAGLGASLGRPEAIVCISAHWDTPQPVASAAERPETIHDFWGFPEILYRIRYPAPGTPELARRTAALLTESGLAAEIDPDRGLDHGAWTPLALMYPEGDVPVFQLSIQTPLGPAHHVALGRALAPLREENVLVLASGSASHNLRDFGRYPFDAAPPAYVTEFDDWLGEAVAAGDVDEVVRFRERAPHGARNHPTDDHFVPLLVAMGAAGDAPKGRRLHKSVSWGVLSMSAFAFD